MGFLKKIFGSHSDHELKRLYPIADKIEAMSDEYAALTDEQLRAKTDEFKAFARNIAMHVAAVNPLALSRDEVSAEVLQREKDIYINQAIESGKPQQIAEKMVAGEIAVFGKPVPIRNPIDAIHSGIMLCTEDRKALGIIPIHSVQENINISARRHKARAGFFINQQWEDENAKLKRMLADSMLDNVALKDLLGKKW